MYRFISAIFLMLTSPVRADDLQPVIQIEDVTLFYKVYDAAKGHPTAAGIQRDYLDAGSDGLRTFAKLRNTTAERIAANIATQPMAYENGRRCGAALPKVRERLQSAMTNLSRIYPDAKFPPVTIAIGRGRPVAIGSPVNGVQIGLEALCAVDFFHADVEDRFVYGIAHEDVHVQQVEAIVDGTNLTVLEASLMEGIAEFVGELISGDIANPNVRKLAAGREAEIEADFIAEMDSRDLSNWMNNTGAHVAPDLGYWIGHRIARAYHQRAADKQKAIRDMLEMTDAKAFLAESGWRPSK